MQNNEHFILFEAPKVEPLEFRLYYDDEGKVLFYTCEKPEGKYLVIDSSTFAQARHDLRVIDGKLSSVNPRAIISKLIPDSTGEKCSLEDVSIVVDDTYSGSTTNWKLTVHEYR